MRSLTTVLLLIITTGYSQTSGEIEPVYDWDYVIKYVRKNKMNARLGTKAIISEITRNYEDEQEQTELIRFYREAYDYKIVDKVILKTLVDSLAIHGLNEEVRAFALESRTLIEHRFLDKEMRDFAFPDKDGKIIRLTSLKEKIVIVELWATWCGPCIKEMKKIPALRKMNSNIEFYSISLDKSPDKMKKFVDKNQYDWPIVFGGDEEANQELWDYLHIVAIPKYYTVDRNGIVTHVADKLDDDYIKNLK